LPYDATYYVREVSVDKYTPKYVDPDVTTTTSINYDLSETITNTYVGYTLPSVGGPGTKSFYGFGAGILLLAAFLLVIYGRKKAKRGSV
jgi:hypothetical protein